MSLLLNDSLNYLSKLTLRRTFNIAKVISSVLCFKVF